MREKTVLIMAGGTGGHVFPAIEIARQLKSLGHQVHWLGTAGGFEADIVKQADIPFHSVHIKGLRGTGIKRKLFAPFKLAKAFLQSFGIFHKVKPDLVIGLGGYASGPGGIVAFLLRKPLVLHEQNTVPGATNRLLSYVARCVCESFPNSFEDKDNVVFTGNPIREIIRNIPSPEQRFKDRTGPIRLLVLGGSQGARVINQTLASALEQMPVAERPEVRLQCGRRELEATQADFANKGVDAQITGFIDDMAEAYAWADLVLCRAGATTVHELMAVGLGSILIPYPYAVDDHQTKNAEYLIQEGAGIIIAQQECDAKRIISALHYLNSREKCLNLAMLAKKMMSGNPTENVIAHSLGVCRETRTIKS